MNWLALRQHRKQFLIAGVFLLAFVAFMIPTGLHFWHTYQYALATCGKTETCGQVDGEMLQSSADQLLVHLVPVAVFFVPVILGLFWGVPLLAREYADGTNKLVWTQSVSRKKWLTVKLIWVLLGAAVTATAFAALNTWWSHTNNVIAGGRFDGVAFGSQGIVLIGYAVFAVSLGICLGAMFKRIMVALGITLVTLIALIIVIVPNFVRPYYYSPDVLTQSLIGGIGSQGPARTAANAPVEANALIVANLVISSSGQPLNWSNPPKQCIRTAPAGPIGAVDNGGVELKHAIAAPGKNGTEQLASENGGPIISMNCMDSLGYKMEFKYQPAYRYWDFQRIETGLFLALSVVPISITYWLVIKRDA